FQRFTGRGSAVNSELCAILHGLEITLNRGYNKVIIETDCMMAAEMIKEVREQGREHGCLVTIDIPSFHVRKLLLEDKLGDIYVRIN
ncbi:hypothetical protein Gorai_006783, partial [Gossypium raimondii]|nr:hypothetical protein [Gossypium raimondii]